MAKNKAVDAARDTTGAVAKMAGKRSDYESYGYGGELMREGKATHWIIHGMLVKTLAKNLKKRHWVIRFRIQTMKLIIIVT